LNSGEFEPFFPMENPFVYELKIIFFSGRNLVKFLPPLKEKHWFNMGANSVFFFNKKLVGVQNVVQM
jgi:hypothetical protein